MSQLNLTIALVLQSFGLVLFTGFVALTKKLQLVKKKKKKEEGKKKKEIKLMKENERVRKKYDGKFITF